LRGEIDMEIYLGKNIKYLREKNNLDQQSLADILNVPRSTLACWENDLRTPKLEQIVKIAEYFNTNLDIIYIDLKNNVSPIEKKNNDDDKKYKKILKDKGLMDENEKIKEEDFNRLIKIADMIQETMDKKKEN
jgi:transcriptional regulator with XRE-family HTH domain